MGQKGDKMTNASTQAAELLLARLAPIEGITAKKMFGGHGVFHEGKMFGIVDSKGNCFLKANASNQADFEEKGSHRHSKMPYFSIPEDVFENADQLQEFAKKSIAIAKAKK